MAEDQPSKPKVDGLMTHFYNVIELDGPGGLEELMMAIARSPERASHILYSAGFLESMVVHINHRILVKAYGQDDAKKFEPTETVRAIAAKVRVNHLMHHALETGLDDLIAGVQDPVIRLNFVEPVAAHTISIVTVAQKTHAGQPVGSQELPPEDPKESKT